MSCDLRLSVVVPVRNRVELLEKCLRSLITQDLDSGSFEIVVCDDGSSEDVGSVVERYAGGSPRVRLERQRPRGPAAARNLGIRASDAPIVVFVDSDVEAERSLLTHLGEGLDRQSDWQGAEAALRPAGADGGVLWDAPSSGEGGRYHTAAIAYRREALETAGGFDELFELPACEDVELAVRVLQRGTIGFVPDAIALHPRRRVDWLTHWRWRRHWRYETILAVRYGILSFPGRRAGQFPRLRIALAAVVTLPIGRMVRALRQAGVAPAATGIACAHAAFDVICGIVALPDILWRSVDSRRNYLEMASAWSAESTQGASDL